MQVLNGILKPRDRHQKSPSTHLCYSFISARALTCSECTLKDHLFTRTTCRKRQLFPLTSQQIFKVSIPLKKEKKWKKKKKFPLLSLPPILRLWCPLCAAKIRFVYFIHFSFKPGLFFISVAIGDGKFHSIYRLGWSQQQQHVLHWRSQPHLGYFHLHLVQPLQWFNILAPRQQRIAQTKQNRKKTHPNTKKNI